MYPSNRFVRFSIYGFLLFFGLALIAFWPSYYSKVGGQTNFRFHTHGICMTLWCLALIVQPFLIRLKKPKIHLWVGKFSFFLVLFIIVSTINLVHFQVKRGSLTLSSFYFLALVLVALVAFVLIYGLAIYHKKRPAVHARYMICTIFPMVTPVTDRLIYHHFRPLVEFVPLIENRVPIVPVIGFLASDLLLVSMAVWDWKSSTNPKPFLSCLGILLIYHFSVLTFYKWSFWQLFCSWFMSLSLS